MDSGSDVNVLPLKLIKKSLRYRLRPCNEIMNGISGQPTKAIGQFKCRTHFRNNSVLCGFFDTSFIVVDEDIPALIGQTILGHPTVKSYTVTKKTITFHWRFKSKDTAQCIPRIGRPNNAFQMAAATKPVIGNLDETSDLLVQNLKFPKNDRNASKADSLSGSRCFFLQKSTKKLDINVDNSGYAPDPGYVEHFSKINEPRTARQLSVRTVRRVQNNCSRDCISPGASDIMAKLFLDHILPHFEETPLEITYGREGARLPTNAEFEASTARTTLKSRYSGQSRPFPSKMSTRQSTKNRSTKTKMRRILKSTRSGLRRPSPKTPIFSGRDL